MSQQQPDQQHPYQPVAQPYQQQGYSGQQMYPMQPLQPTAPPKSPGVAVILSFLICGAGHLYTGNPLAAVLWFSAAFVSGLLIWVLIGFVLLPAVWIGACVHAYVSANAFNRRHHAVL